MQKIISLSLFFLLSHGLSWGQTTLEQYVEMALANHPALLAGEKRHAADLSRTDQVNAFPEPQVGVNVFVLPVETRLGPQRAGLTVSQPFPWVGTLGARASVAEAKAEVSRWQVDDQRLQVAYAVQRQYYQLYELEAAIRLTASSLDRLRNLVDLAHIRFEADRGSMADVLRIELEINEQAQKLALLRDNRRPLIQAFGQVLNQPELDSVNLPDSLKGAEWPISRDSLRALMLRNHPALRRFEAEAEAHQRQGKADQFEGKPGFSLGLGYANVGPRTDAEVPGNGRDILQVMAGIRIPLARRKYAAQQQEAQLRTEASQAQRTDFANGLLTQLEQAWRDLADAERRISLYQQQQQLATQTLDLLLASYSVAGGNFEELLRMDRKLLAYALQGERAQVDQHLAVARLTYLLGQ
jgi:outer membrane protein TolC